MRFLLFLILINSTILSQNNINDLFYVSHYTVSNGLPSNSVYAAIQDKSGNVWFATENGISRFDGNVFYNYGIRDGLKDNSIFNIKISNSMLFAYSFKGVDYIYNNKIMSNQYKLLNKPFKDFTLFDDYFDQKYISARDDSIFIYDLKNRMHPKLMKKTSYDNDNFPYVFYQIFKKFHNKLHIHLISNRNLILYSQDKQEIKIYETKKDSIHNIEIPNKFKEIRAISSHENKFFISDNNSLYVYDLVNFKLVYQKKVSFPSTVNSVFYKDGLYYVNTLTDGVYILREKGKNITIDQLQISGIEVDTSNQIAVGVKEDYPKYYNHFGKSINKKINGTNNCKPLLVNNQISWVNDFFIDYKQKRYNIPNLIKYTCVYNKDTILVGTRSFAMLYDLKMGKKVKHLLDKWTVGFCVTQKNDIYIASPSGLYRYEKNGQVKKIKFTNVENLKVNSVAEDLQGNIWINTAGFGIYIYTPSTKKVVNLQTKDGLLSDNNSKIIIDKNNRKWILSNFGILVIDGKRFFKINESEGLMSNEIIDLKVVNDTAWIASNMGLNKYVYVNNNNKIWIPLNINEIKINNQLVDSMPKRLTPIQNKIQFDFIGVYIAAAEEIKYNYRLSFDETKGKWQKTDQNLLVFENLQHGHYELEIEAYHANYPNIRSKILKIPFIINPHFYQTFIFWFFIFLVLLLVSSFIIYRIVKQRKQRELEKAELLAKVNESNLKSLQGQMNPHFVFNSLSTLQNLVLNQKDAEVLEYISEFSKLMRTMLDNSRNDIISLIDEIEFLKNYIDLEQIRFKNFFEVQWDMKIPLDDLEEIYIPTMLIQPIIENAIKHGVSKINSYKGIIEIIIDLPQHDFIEIRVKDNGSNSLISNNKHTSTAIKVIHERLELYQRNNKKGKFELDIKPNGAEALLTIPV